ncbi:MAG TPA: homoserine dehydrogenase [Candidatus Fimivivens faecavium]|nr:homoserine dehydrogenase [Candidatus Fimivivens faecavium]
MTKIAIIGFGVVGSGVAEVFYKNRQSIEKKAGRELDIKYIVDVRSLEGTVWADKAGTYEQALADPEVGVMIETIGGLTPAYDFSKRALLAGKHVITSNKELVAAHGAELLGIAKENNVNYLFEASVGGGIPIIHPLYQCLGAGEVEEIAGILNGTTNFIMTRMFRDKMSFEQALGLAQDNGYAERNPAADVEGTDACRKICILASIAFGSHVYPDNIHTEGIAALTAEDVAAAASAGYVIKLIGRAKKTEKGLMVMVSPALISQESQLANVSDVFNGILVRSSDTGDVVFYGRGAGKLPTAAAVISDLVDAMKEGGHIDSLGWEDSGRSNVADWRDDVTRMMFRTSGLGRTEIQRIFGTVEPIQGAAQEERAFLTEPVSGRQTEEWIRLAKAAGAEVRSAIRVLEY